jgi:hypothetical protein
LKILAVVCLVVFQAAPSVTNIPWPKTSDMTSWNNEPWKEQEIFSHRQCQSSE